MIELKGYKVNKLEIENRAKPGTQLKLQNQLKYNVNYMDDNKTCVGMLEPGIEAMKNSFSGGVLENNAVEFIYFNPFCSYSYIP